MFNRQNIFMWLGYGLFTGMMAVGYAYNVTFIQLGLVDLGSRLLELDRASIAANMALMAIITCAIALGLGYAMLRIEYLRRFTIKLRMAWLSIILQTALTMLVLTITSESDFRLWIVAASLALGIGVPATFSMTVDLIQVRHRGIVAAAITAVAYFISAVLLTEWHIETFMWQMLLVMIPGAIALTILAFLPLPFTRQWSRQHEHERFAIGRFVHRAPDGGWRVRRRIIMLLVLMFAIYFIDSLGFLRILETPVYLNTAWQSDLPDVRLFIGVTHIGAALIAGVLYRALDERQLFLWIFGIFALVHLMYSLHDSQWNSASAPLGIPMLYAVAVSLYTVVNFALWADISTPRTIGLYTALGVAFSGWAATFLSTALSLQWTRDGVSLGDHLRAVDALALLFFAAFLLVLYFRGGRTSHKEQTT